MVRQPESFSDLQVLPNRILQSNYGIAIPEGSSLRKDLNIMILRKLTSPEYRSIINRYIGREDS
jgi:polar amino acid transport system substrate-binding protein